MARTQKIAGGLEVFLIFGEQGKKTGTQHQALEESFQECGMLKDYTGGDMVNSVLVAPQGWLGEGVWLFHG